MVNELELLYMGKIKKSAEQLINPRSDELIENDFYYCLGIILRNKCSLSGKVEDVFYSSYDALLEMKKCILEDKLHKEISIIHANEDGF